MNAGNRFEVAAERLQTVFFPVDLAPGADAAAAEHGNRRAPALQPVSQQETGDYGRKL